MIRRWKLGILAAVAIAAGFVAWIDLRHHDGIPAGTTTPLVTTDPPKPAATPAASAINLLPLAEEAARLNDPTTTVQDDLGILDLLLGGYHGQYGENPVGENDEITAALTGRNLRALAWLPPGGPFLDPQGRLIDRWGTPYFFHAESGDHMQIRSAGPDRKMWTADDATEEQGR